MNSDKKGKKKGKFLLTPALRIKREKGFSKRYKDIVSTEEAKELLKKRKTSCEPFFNLIKEPFGLNGRRKLSIKGRLKVRSFLLLGVFFLQIAMLVNDILGFPFRETSNKDLFIRPRSCFLE